MSIDVNSYFSGAGLMDLGLLEAGLNVQQSFELDEKAVATANMNFDHRVVRTDISEKLVGAELPCDVMVGTYPCTKYSTIADISGSRTGDELFLHFFRHLAIKKPEVYVIENVPGMKKFPIVMEAMTQLPEYYVSVFCPLKTTQWLPQHRDRLILIGSKTPFNWREPEHTKPVTLADIIEPSPEVRITDAIIKRLSGVYRDKPIISDPEKGDIAPTCVAHYSKDRSTRLVVDRSHSNKYRPYTVKEYARLQGVPDWFQFAGSDNDAMRQIGNGVPVKMAEWIGKEIQRYFGRDRSKTYFVNSQASLF